MRFFVFLVVFGSFVGGCTYLNKKLGLPDDNALEELVEDIVETHLGLPEDSLDLTPNQK